MGFWDKFKKKHDEEQQNSPPVSGKTGAGKQAEKRIKQQQKQKVRQKKADQALLKSALTFSKDIQKLSKKYHQVDDQFFEDLEAILIKTDMGMKLVLTISRNLQKKVDATTSMATVKDLLSEEIYDLYHQTRDNYELDFKPDRLNVFLVIGVNGTGKTTSVAKLANYYASQGFKVLIAAADTFRAGAVEQLQEWTTTRLENVDLFTMKTSDPSSVIFDALKKGQAENYDLLIIDTAGRLQNKVNLMQELEKMNTIVHRFDKKAPHETLLVIDATTGQNGVMQAEQFDEVTNISGIILTKMDGTSKGGIALAIKNQLKIPVKLMGIGEQVEDLVPFNVDDYIYGLTSGFMENEDENE